MNINKIATAVEHLQSLAPEIFAPITNGEQLKKAIELLKAMDDEMGDHDSHPLKDVADQLMQRILKYEEEHHPIPDMYGGEYLEFLLEKHNISQCQLAQETGIHQNIIGDLLNGKCRMNIRHICIFAKYFDVAPEYFLPIELVYTLHDMNKY